MKLFLFPKGHRARQSAYLILISFLLLMVFYVIDDFLLHGQAVGVMFFMLNVLVVLSWLSACLGTFLGILSIYKTKEFSFLLLALLFMGFTFSIFGLLDIFIK